MIELLIADAPKGIDDRPMAVSIPLDQCLPLLSVQFHTLLICTAHLEPATGIEPATCCLQNQLLYLLEK